MRASLWVLLAWLMSASAQAAWVSDTRDIMGTEIRVTLWHPDPDLGKRAVDAVMEEMRRIDAALSPYKPASELSQVNERAAVQPVKLSGELAYLVDRSLHYSRISDGAFDITFASVGSHYDYRSGRKPSPQLHEKLLPALNYRLLQFDPKGETLGFARAGVQIDLGGIAKGYAVDRAVAILRKMRVQHATVSAGGDSRVVGDKRGEPWLVGIKNPRLKGKNDRPVVLTLPLEEVAVSTSGDYERYFIDSESGERVHHIINPRTGKSADSVMSATVLGPEAIDTDALSTTVFVLGVERGLALINSLVDFDAVIIDSAGKVHYSDGLESPAS